MRAVASVKPWMERWLPGGTGHRIADDTLWVGAEVIVSRGGTLLALLLAARWLGPEQFGALVAVQGTIVLLGSAIALAMRIAATTELSRIADADAGRLLSVVTATTLAGVTTMAGATLLLAVPLAREVLANADLAPMLRIGAALLVVDCVTALQLGILTGCRALRQAALGSTIAGLLLVACVAIGTQAYGAAGALWGLTAGGLAGIVLRAPAMQRALATRGVSRLHMPTPRDFRALGRLSLPTLALNLVWTPTTWAASMLLVRSADGYAEMGYLGAANQWFAALMFLPNVLGLATLPTLSAALANRDRGELHATAMTALRASLLVIVPVAIVTCALSPWIMRLYGPEYEHAWSALALLALASIPATAIAVCTNVLTVLGHWRSLLLAQGAWAVTYLCATFGGVQLGAGAAALGAAMLAGNAMRLLFSARSLRRATIESRRHDP